MRIILLLFSFFPFIVYAQMTFEGISCWGDSKTQGNQEPGISYPSILQDLLTENHYDITVYNFGAHGEKSTEIMQRQGARELIVQPFTIPESFGQEVKISINSRLRVPEAGCNPCVINGIEGAIRHDWNDANQKTFYFSRFTDGDAVVVDKPTRVITNAMQQHRNDILIMDIGYNGGFSSVGDWINQYKEMVDYSECKEYIVIGRASHYYVTSTTTEEAFSEAFGDRYISLSQYYVDHGLEDAGITPTPTDLNDIKAGRPPQSLFLDDHHENAYGYAIKAKLVYQKLLELGFLTPHTSISTIDNDNCGQKTGIYTLQGQKIKTISRSGIYIVNGKKIYIKK